MISYFLHFLHFLICPYWLLYFLACALFIFRNSTLYKRHAILLPKIIYTVHLLQKRFSGIWFLIESMTWTSYAFITAPTCNERIWKIMNVFFLLNKWFETSICSSNSNIKQYNKFWMVSMANPMIYPKALHIKHKINNDGLWIQRYTYILRQVTYNESLTKHHPFFNTVEYVHRFILDHSIVE